jgi:hypothetical protein
LFDLRVWLSAPHHVAGQAGNLALAEQLLWLTAASEKAVETGRTTASEATAWRKQFQAADQARNIDLS